MRFAAAIIAVLTCIAGAAAAAPIVNLKSLSPTGDRAIVTYDRHWGELTLRDDGEFRALRAPKGCSWSSMSYAATGDALAMTAFCPAPTPSCDESASMLLVSRDGAAPQPVVKRQGARWTGAIWQADRDRVHLIEATVTRPLPMGLNDLSVSVQPCGWTEGAMKVVDVPTGAVIAWDVLPRPWAPRAVIAADDQAIVAVVAAKRGATDGSPASRTIAAVCADPSLGDRALSAVCKPSGYDLVMTWRDGDWIVGAGDWTGQQAFPGRAVVAPLGGAVAREDCQILRQNTTYRLACELTVARAGVETVIQAPKGQFGDIALSGDGATLAAIAAGRSLRNRRFDIWDLNTGEKTSLSHLLLPEQVFKVWPPR